jgi:hypothetical protein
LVRHAGLGQAAARLDESAVKNFQVVDLESGSGGWRRSTLPESAVVEGDSLQV